MKHGRGFEATGIFGWKRKLVIGGRSLGGGHRSSVVIGTAVLLGVKVRLGRRWGRGGEDGED